MLHSFNMTKTMMTFVSFLLLALSAYSKDPGLPVQNPTISYWQTPPYPDVADRQSPQLPSSADVVIIGSGMTGASVANYLLKNGSQTQPLRIAMLEARQACSGATGRNGGHIRPSSYSEYDDAKRRLGNEQAAKITRLRVAHVDALIAAAKELGKEGEEASEARTVDSIDAFFDEASYKAGFQQLDVLKNEVPDIGSEFTSFGQEQTRKDSLLVEATGMITGSPKVAGAIWPYRFVTHTLKALLDKYPSFSLDTNTPALSVSSGGTGNTTYVVDTPRGKIQTRHVIHAANAWIPHFVPGMDGKISGSRLHMSAQLGGAGLPKAGQWPSYTGNGSLSTGRAWSLFRGGLDYVVQMPRNGEYMFGGGPTCLGRGGSDGPGGPDGAGENSTDDSLMMDDSAPPNHDVAAYLNGALPNYFGYDTWGSERADFPLPNDPAVWKGRTKRVWTGIEGGSWDGRPIVGQLPTSVTNRPIGTKGSEWIATAYDGEGMCFAWLCGKALSTMVLSSETSGNITVPDWFPQSLEITKARLNAPPSNDTSRLHKRMTRMGAIA